ncbi:hypothetical protein BGW80DRAFT_594423 [Lactifluus volemus]|nr:hypothetical protein BGW80DRAFT_594423 [Lactifluus volemus]
MGARHVQAISRYASSISRRPESDSTIASTDLVMMVLLVFELQDTLERARLVDALRSKRMSALDETEDLMWKSGYFLVSWIFWKIWARQLVSKDDQVPMDVDPSVKRQRIESMDDKLFIHYADNLSTPLLDTSAGGGEHPTADIDLITPNKRSHIHRT